MQYIVCVKYSGANDYLRLGRVTKGIVVNSENFK